MVFKGAKRNTNFSPNTDPSPYGRHRTAKQGCGNDSGIMKTSTFMYMHLTRLDAVKVSSPGSFLYNL